MTLSRSPVDPVDDRVIVRHVVLPLGARVAFDLFATPAGLQAWLCGRAAVGSAVGEPYELFWDPLDPQNDSTIGCRITAYLPLELIGFQWRSPRQFKAFANAADPLTHVVVTFHPRSDGTAVTLVHSGWRAAAPWPEAAAWQVTAWDHAWAALARHAAHVSDPSRIVP